MLHARHKKGIAPRLALIFINIDSTEPPISIAPEAIS